MAAIALAHDALFRLEEAARIQGRSPSAVVLHDLRQPLSSIQAIAYYLEMTIPAHLIEAQAMLVRMQDLVQDASGLLERAEKSTLER